MRSRTRIGTVVGVLLVLPAAASTPTWTELAPTGSPPAARMQFSMVRAPETNRLIVFGGGSDGEGYPPFFNDTWLLLDANGIGGPAWVQVVTAGGPPSTRAGHTAVYDPTTNVMTMFAGNPSVGNCYNTANDTWVLTNADDSDPGQPTWSQLQTSGGPPGQRWGHSAVYDPATNRMIVFGGHDACAAGDSQVWVLDNANGQGNDTPTWMQLAPTGGPPGARAWHTAVYDGASNRMMVFGGVGTSGSLNDVWVLEHANGLGGTPNWMQLAPTGGPPSARTGHHAVYDNVGNRLIVFGGTVAGSPVGDLWSLENANGLGGTPAWVPLAPGGTAPSIRAFGGTVYDLAENRLTLFGGRTFGNVTLNDTWVLETGGAVNPCAGDGDADGDGVCDSVDNCPFTANPDQTDANGDGIGDACAPDPVVEVDALVDMVEALDLPASTVSTLTAARSSLERGNIRAARGQLGAFINQLRALQRSGRLEAATAEALTAAAEVIIGLIGSP